MVEKDLSNNGERSLFGISPWRLVQEVVARYLFAAGYVEFKKVLDVGCGVGHGTQLMALYGRPAQITGLDIDSDVVEHAGAGNRIGSSLDYTTGTIAEISGTYDVITAFEVIEHIDAYEEFLDALYDHLDEHGIAIISTPNKMVTSPFTHVPLNRFHVREFYRGQLFDILKQRFAHVECWGQRAIPPVLCKKYARLIIRTMEKVFKADFGVYTTLFSSEVQLMTSRREPRIQIYVCTK